MGTDKADLDAIAASYSIEDLARLVASKPPSFLWLYGLGALARDSGIPWPAARRALAKAARDHGIDDSKGGVLQTLRAAYRLDVKEKK